MREKFVQEGSSLFYKEHSGKKRMKDKYTWTTQTGMDILRIPSWLSHRRHGTTLSPIPPPHPHPPPPTPHPPHPPTPPPPTPHPPHTHTHENFMLSNRKLTRVSEYIGTQSNASNLSSFVRDSPVGCVLYGKYRDRGMLESQHVDASPHFAGVQSSTRK